MSGVDAEWSELNICMVCPVKYAMHRCMSAVTFYGKRKREK